MLGLLSKIWRLLLIPLFAGAFFLGAYFFFYRGGYDPPPTVDIPLERIEAPSSGFTFIPDTPSIQKGMLLLDGAHLNDFDKGEISALLSRVSDHGFSIELIGETSQFGGFRRMSLGQRLFLLDENLRRADSLLVILPEDPYTVEEVDLVEQFVRKGGKLLLIADPTRDHQINSLAERFNIAFQPDYLYNSAEYDINFQNIFVRDFRPDQITDGLTAISLYTAGSIRSLGVGLAVTDGNTRSSMVERVEPFYPIVKSDDGRVLAISDLTFMIPHQNAILANDRLVSNIADYLTDSLREFELADFPHVFKGDVDILLGQAALFDLGTEFKKPALRLSDYPSVF